MSLTNYGETYVLGLIKSAKTYYLGVLTATPTDSSDGTEVTGGAYARQAITFAVPVSGDPSSMTNAAAIEFPTATAGWGTVVAWGVYDAATGGNLVWYGTLSTAKELSANDTIIVHAGDLKLTID